jgi:hypothetical protein
MLLAELSSLVEDDATRLKVSLSLRFSDGYLQLPADIQLLGDASPSDTFGI